MTDSNATASGTI